MSDLTPALVTSESCYYVYICMYSQKKNGSLQIFAEHMLIFQIFAKKIQGNMQF